MAFDLNPDSEEIFNLLKICKQKLNKSKQNEKKLYSQMF